MSSKSDYYIFSLSGLEYRELVLYLSFYTILNSLIFALSPLAVSSSFIMLNIILTLAILFRVIVRDKYRSLLKPDIISLIIYTIYNSIYQDSIASLFPITLIIITLGSKILLEQVLITPLYIERKTRRVNVVKYGNQISKNIQDIFPGEILGIKPNLIVPADLEIVRGKVIVREPLTSDKVVEKGAGDVVISGSIVEGGYAETVTLTSYWDSIYNQTFGKDYIGIIRRSSYVSTFIIAIIMVVYLITIYRSMYPGILEILGLEFLIYALPISFPVIYASYMIKISSRIYAEGLYTNRSLDLVNKMCKSKYVTIKIDSIIGRDELDNYIIISKSPYRIEEVVTLICLANLNDIGRSKLCGNLSPLKVKRYVIVSRYRHAVILEDKRSRIHICVGDLEYMKELNYSTDINELDRVENINKCSIPLIAVATRYDIIGLLCISKNLEEKLLSKVNELRSIKDLLVVIDEDTYQKIKPIISEVFDDEFIKNKIVMVPKVSSRSLHDEYICSTLNLAKDTSIIITSEKGINGDYRKCGFRYIATMPSTLSKKIFRELLAKIIGNRIDGAVDINRLTASLELIDKNCMYRSKMLSYIAAYMITKTFTLLLGVASGILWTLYITEIASMIIFSSYVIARS